MRYTVQPSAHSNNILQLSGFASGSPVAVGSVQLKIDRARSVGTIQNLRVHPDHRQRGLATMLMQSTVAQARMRGLSSVNLVARAEEPGLSGMLVGFY